MKNFQKLMLLVAPILLLTACASKPIVLCSDSSKAQLQEIFPGGSSGIMTKINQKDRKGCAYDFGNVGASVVFYKDSDETQYDGALARFKDYMNGQGLDQKLGLGEKSFYFDSGAIGNLYVLKDKVVFEATVSANDLTAFQRKNGLMEVYRRAQNPL